IRVQGKGIDYINLRIFDRIGEKVFTTTSLENGWDGKLFGLGMDNNVFVYMLEVTYCNGETVKEQGNITLVK
ncbi:MAG: gliding motility-associated C-terminal domain-containing protein, partial [Bacteroidota bacterium]|nr:gliding motility-associated C-terminal domain-containing protein [Bacteroidota bacterium]